MPDERRAPDAPNAVVRPLVRTRQYRHFTDEPPTAAAIDAIVDVARWTGSSQNLQPWRFIVIRDIAVIRELANAGMSLTRSLQTATAAVAIVLPADSSAAVWIAYDEGRASERMLIAASMLGLGAGIAWLKGDAPEVAARMLGLPADRSVRTVIALGHPSEAGRAPKAAPGQARLPRAQTVFEERWPSG